MQNEMDEEIPNIERQGWSAEKISEEATNKDSDEIVRQMRRGDETDGRADERDSAGSAEKNETPQGREETKNK